MKCPKCKSVAEFAGNVPIESYSCTVCRSVMEDESGTIDLSYAFAVNRTDGLIIDCEGEEFPLSESED